MNTKSAKANFTVRPDSANLIAYGGYIANVAGGIDCHSKFTEKGEMVLGTAFGGKAI